MRLLFERLRHTNCNQVSSLSLCYLAYVFGCFFVHVQYAFFYGLVVPGFLYFIYKNGLLNTCKAYRQTPLYQLFGALWLWCGLSIVWGINPSTHESWHALNGVVATAIFTTGLILVTARDMRFIPLLEGAFIAGATLNALASIVLDVTVWHKVRFGGFLLTGSPILGAMVVCMGALFAVYRLFNVSKNHWVYVLCLVICLLFIVMTRSRGPYLATLASMGVLSLGLGQRSKTWLAAIGGVVVLAFIIVAWGAYGLDLHAMWHLLADRGANHRFDIWQYTAQRIMHNPVLGYGPAAPFGYSFFEHPHSLYLSTWFYYGFIGFALLITLLANAIGWLVRNWRTAGINSPLWMALLVNVLVGGLTDISQITEGPGIIWFLLWVPLGVIYGVMADVAMRKERA